MSSRIELPEGQRRPGTVVLFGIEFVDGVASVETVTPSALKLLRDRGAVFSSALEDRSLKAAEEPSPAVLRYEAAVEAASGAPADPGRSEVDDESFSGRRRSRKGEGD